MGEKSISSKHQIEPECVREQLHRILASEVFAHGERQSRFLRHIVEAMIEGRSNAVGQHSIGQDVFDRNSDFDPTIDSVVRVEAGRLRSKLTEYYARTGRDDPIVIDLPKGGYAPTFSRRSDAPEPLPQISRASRPRSETRKLFGLTAAALVLGMLFWQFLPFFIQGNNRSSSTEPPDRSSIAVLPFDNMSADPDQEYFSDGISEDIITDLSLIADLKVIARHSTFVYKDRAISIGEIGRELGVAYVLEGSVRREGDRLRITAQLIDAASETHVWADRYDRDASDVFDVQDDVTAHIVQSLELALTDTESERLNHRGTENIEAHDLYLRGQERFWRLDDTSVEQAINLFNGAIQVDPEYAEAYAWSARALTFAYLSGQNPSKAQTIDRAGILAKQAIQIDPELAMAYANLAWSIRWNGDLTKAIQSVNTAIARDPNFADAYLWKSMILSAALDGQGSLEAIQQAIELNPNFSVTYTLALGRAYAVLGDLETALTHFRRTVERNPSFLPGLVHEAYVLDELGRLQDAGAAFSNLKTLFPSYEVSPSFKSLQAEWSDS